MATYARLMLVACIFPRSTRVVLQGNERSIRVTQLGNEEFLDLELGLNGSTQARLRIVSEGEHDLPRGFAWCSVTKSGQGSPTTVELIHDA